MLPAADRILARVERVDGCWLWPGADNGVGYGKIKVEGGVGYVHRVIYEALVGPIPAGLTLDHLCRNPSCCNPAHLEPVTQGENNRRAPTHLVNKTECSHGHGPLTIYGGRRCCRTCVRARQNRKP